MEKNTLDTIRERMDALPGHVGMYYKNLVTGYEYSVRGEETYLAASVIKFPLYMHVRAQAAAGAWDMSDRLTVSDADKVPSCGALNMFTGSVEADLSTLCRLMICISDNTATNRLINFCTMQGVEQGFADLGLRKTRIRRLLFDREASARGIQNTICPREMGMLLEKLYRGEFVSTDVSAEILDTLKKQQIEHKLDGKLCGEVPIAHKTGEDDRLSNDVGIVYAPQPFILCCAGHDTDVYAWEDLIRNAAYDLVHCQK